MPAPTATAPDEPAADPGADVAASAPSGGPLERAVQDFVAAQAVPFSVVAVDLVAGTGAYHLADRQVLSASLYKLFVARELLRRVHAGELARTEPMGEEEGRTVGACIRDMVVLSDNACGVAGLGMVGRGDQDAGLHAFGFSSTSLASPQRTTAADVALFLRTARDGSLFGPGGEAASAELYGLLAEQAVRDRFPLGLPAGTPLAHKTGDRVGWAHDAGIFSTPTGDVLLVALSGPWAPPCCDADRPGPAEAVAFGALADLARAVYAATA
ncbi:MAG: serine hydrolase [Acidimicrobiia bacterium]